MRGSGRREEGGGSCLYLALSKDRGHINNSAVWTSAWAFIMDDIAEGSAGCQEEITDLLLVMGKA
jgi:hypothetical protein